MYANSKSCGEISQYISSECMDMFIQIKSAIEGGSSVPGVKIEKDKNTGVQVLILRDEFKERAVAEISGDKISPLPPTNSNLKESLQHILALCK